MMFLHSDVSKQGPTALLGDLQLHVPSTMGMYHLSMRTPTLPPHAQTDYYACILAQAFLTDLGLHELWRLAQKR